MAIDVTTSNFASLKTAPGALLLDVWAPWCQPCKAVEPIVTDLAERYGERLQLAKLNVEAEPELAEHLGISGLPTVRIIVGGQMAYETVGTVSRDALTVAVAGVLGEADR